MKLNFLLLLIMSLFIISCLADTENTEETVEDPFDLATGEVSDRDVERAVIDRDDRVDMEISTNERKSDWIAPPRPSDGAQEYSDFRVSTDLVEYFDVSQDCNPNIIRTPQVYINWTRSSLTSPVMRLDVTHYGTRTGFAPNAFVSLDISPGSNTPFINVYSQDEELDRNSTLPDLYLTWFDVPESRGTERRSDNLIIVEGLEAGINYTWRLVGSLNGRTVATPSQTTQTNVCVADVISNE